MSAGGRPPPPTDWCWLLTASFSWQSSFSLPFTYHLLPSAPWRDYFFFFLAFFFMFWITPFRAQYPIASRLRYSACSRPRRS